MSNYCPRCLGVATPLQPPYPLLGVWLPGLKAHKAYMDV